MSASRIPSPPAAQGVSPGSPVFQHRSPSSPDSQSANLYQHLQHLHLTQQRRGSGSPTFRRSSPPNLAQVHCQQQGSESPPHSYPNLLQNFQQGHQRNSPPPNFQNLQIIKEDSVDLDKSSQSESEEEMLVQEEATTSDLQVSQHTFTSKPQISITDTQGHVTAVTSDGDSESEKGESPRTSSVSTSSQTPVSPSKPTCNYSMPFVNTNLTSIPPENQDSGSGLPTDQYYNTNNVQWYNPQYAYLQRLHGLHYASNVHKMYSNISGYFSNAQRPTSNSPMGGWEMYNNVGLDNYQSSKCSTGRNFFISGDLHMDCQRSDREKLHKTASDIVLDEGCNLSKFGSLFNVSSKRSVADILNDIRKILDDSGPHIAYKCSENRFQLANSDVSMEVEVCEEVDASRLQVRRISGDHGCYQQLCHELLAGINI